MVNIDPRYEIVRKTQIEIFRRSGIAPHDYEGIIELLSPQVIAEDLGLSYIVVEELTSSSSMFKTAGILDRRNKQIIVSNEFPVEQQRLTGMHEVVHWMLHEHIGRDVMHRDRPISIVPEQHNIDYVEWEATHIACLSLMPEKMVKERFAVTFRLPYGQALELDEDAAFYLNREIEELRKMTLRQKSLLLVMAHSFERPFDPLHKFFKMSPTAMAIRLEELELIAPDRWKGTPRLRIVR